ncbi:MAG TPA: spermidine acetyltransferase [Lachnoclostridium sp.]|jgi:diamine N-acetyltransferase|uniref:GNAT family N-acetyltransferase n=1 Tax=Lacrimispora sp. TaxID=2719234 RepID=UPI000EE1E644|nr:GNAT family N-acetyltransferase [Lacrimispora sp.]HCD46019.1 spermidine acetyltransferase [Lachnoclostridium sp.]
MITLNSISRDNFHDVINLSVFDEQKAYVASNVYSLAQAKAQPECVPLAVYNDSDLVGFVMYGMDFDDKEYWIGRIMIDSKYQQMGYGRAAMQCVLSILRQDPDHDKVYLSFEPENLTAKKLYEELGFVADGRVIDGEIVYCLHYRK